MKTVVVTDPPRASLEDATALGEYGVATVHEAAGRVGYLGPRLRPAWSGARVGGTAVTVLCWPGDNLMIHVAVEQCRAGDVLVVATNSPSSDGAFGELFATALRHRGVRGVVLGCGVRDVAELREMGFPAWSTAVSAQGTVKATAGAVNVPITLEGQVIHPGDVIVADDDGVARVPRGRAPEVRRLSAARVAKEDASRAAFADGELGLDRYGLRERLGDLGIRYVSYSDHLAEEGT
ncbi:MAG TPA: 4-carboxy-4-hydroxy-2-oxoadipate aldolase/oxaloacetate decarboxylase [Stackebrandtia sp.]|jgi:4-hydroxy-4-methyl-2-oxoglutarate aldolase|uniref:4-carboxy-4-hydroxy-2-oxoadipate aldolase/oxaloacetate decarboxylase n=1 Tax=Stackebrandtia sp. TaxID=2023065 RepID=UPI002D2989C6|nr:4-carboxy-4-hydroxy-2-oxoadipate aldolase/oxaloacetate decarboxylase [Stackebrandtia sp.]HZE40858.1 4-carboxy-4-hydroxy-2-oxoadipate aldolase/oxaloacetate decarboxylase [Stackebrandtia sp.]